MTLPINYFTIGLAAFPIFVFLMLFIFKWRTAEAAPVAALISIFVSVGAFKASAMLVAVEGTKGVWNGIAITFALWTAVLLYWILHQAKFAKAVFGADYHRSDLAKQMEAERIEDRKEMAMPEIAISYGVLAAAVLLFAVCPPLNKAFGFCSPGFNFPENGTGYGFVNAAAENYSPLLPVIHAGVLILIVDLIGLIVLGVKGQLKHGGLIRVLKKSIEMTSPAGIAITSIFTMLAVMTGTGQLLALTAGSISAVNVLAAAILVILIIPFDIRLTDKKRVKELIQADEDAKQSKAAGKKIIVHKTKFYETREGALTIAFAVVLFAFFLMVVGLWGSDETLVLDGFAAVVTAMVFCPMRTFIFEKAKYLI